MRVIMMNSEVPASTGPPGEEPEVRVASVAVSESTKEKSLAELLNDLSRELTGLLHEEVELAKAEVTAKGKRLGAGVGLFGGAVVLALLSLGCLAACTIAALALAVPTWLAALLVAVTLLAVAVVLGLMGKADVQRGSPPIPEEAVESTKEDVAWLKTQLKSAKP
jgi:uncharacterized membrane protein YqjE